MPISRLFTSLPVQAAGSSLLLSPNEVIRLFVADVSAFHGSSPLGVGGLYVTTARLVFLPVSGVGGLFIDYPRVSLHAVCRDDAAFPNPCLYCQVAPLPGADGGDARADAEAGEGATEDVYFAPPAGADLNNLFAAVTACTELWPDEEGLVDLGEGGGEEGALPSWFSALAEGEGAVGDFGVAGGLLGDFGAAGGVLGQFEDA